MMAKNDNVNDAVNSEGCIILQLILQVIKFFDLIKN